MCRLLTLAFFSLPSVFPGEYCHLPGHSASGGAHWMDDLDAGWMNEAEVFEAEEEQLGDEMLIDEGELFGDDQPELEDEQE